MNSLLLNNNSQFDSLFANLNKLNQNFYKQLLFLNSDFESKFPLIEKYLKKDENGNIEAIHLKIFAAGFSKDDLSIKYNENNHVLLISGNPKETRKHFPQTNDRLVKLTNNVSQRSFSIKLNINGFNYENFDYSDGVLSFDLIPLENEKNNGFVEVKI